MDPFGIAIVAAFVISVIVLLGSRANSSPLGKLVPRGRVHPVGAVRCGRVHVRGVVRPGEATITAPLSGEAVVAYRLIIEGRDGPHSWSREVDQSEVSDFLLDDEGAVARVSGADALLLLSGAVTQTPDTRSDLSAVVLDLIAHHCQYTPAPHQSGEWRWTEVGLAEGERVHVMGQASTVPARGGHHLMGGGAYRGIPTELRLAGSSERPLIISDRDRPSLLALLALPSGDRVLPPR